MMVNFFNKILKNGLKSLAILFVKFYRKYISPMKQPSCIYIPSCSSYSLEALERYGFIKGSYLSIRRIIRCNPFSKGGYDPVPYKEEKG